MGCPHQPPRRGVGRCSSQVYTSRGGKEKWIVARLQSRHDTKTRRHGYHSHWQTVLAAMAAHSHESVPVTAPATAVRVTSHSDESGPPGRRRRRGRIARNVTVLDQIVARTRSRPASLKAATTGDSDGGPVSEAAGQAASDSEPEGDTSVEQKGPGIKLEIQ